MPKFWTKTQENPRIIHVPSRTEIIRHEYLRSVLSKLLLTKPPIDGPAGEWPHIVADCLQEAQSAGVSVDLPFDPEESLFQIVLRLFYGEQGEQYDPYSENTRQLTKWRDRAEASFSSLLSKTNYDRWHEKTIKKIQTLYAFYLIEHQDYTLNCLGVSLPAPVDFIDAYARIYSPPEFRTDFAIGAKSFAGAYYLREIGYYKVNSLCEIRETQYQDLLSVVLIEEIPPYRGGRDLPSREEFNKELSFGILDLKTVKERNSIFHARVELHRFATASRVDRKVCYLPEYESLLFDGDDSEFPILQATAATPLEERRYRVDMDRAYKLIGI